VPTPIVNLDVTRLGGDRERRLEEDPGLLSPHTEALEDGLENAPGVFGLETFGIPGVFGLEAFGLLRALLLLAGLSLLATDFDFSMEIRRAGIASPVGIGGARIGPSSSSNVSSSLSWRDVCLDMCEVCLENAPDCPTVLDLPSDVFGLEKFVDLDTGLTAPSLLNTGDVLGLASPPEPRERRAEGQLRNGCKP